MYMEVRPIPCSYEWESIQLGGAGQKSPGSGEEVPTRSTQLPWPSFSRRVGDLWRSRNGGEGLASRGINPLGEQSYKAWGGENTEQGQWVVSEGVRLKGSASIGQSDPDNEKNLGGVSQDPGRTPWVGGVVVNNSGRVGRGLRILETCRWKWVGLGALGLFSRALGASVKWVPGPRSSVGGWGAPWHQSGVGRTLRRLRPGKLRDS